MRRVTSINIPAICLLWLHTSVESVGDLRGGVGGLRSGNLARGENLRLRGGALHGASLTRWQHADMTITEVRFVVCARGYILCVILRFLCSSLALSPYLPAYLPASPLPPFVPLCLSLSLMQIVKHASMRFAPITSFLSLQFHLQLYLNKINRFFEEGSPVSFSTCPKGTVDI